jgi:IS1 family transposase
MRLPLAKAVTVLKLLSEGCSVRATVRLSGVAKDTVLALLNVVGQKLTRLMMTKFNNLPVNDVQVDEIWGFVGMKERTRVKNKIDDLGVGDAYCYVAIERDTKVILAWHLGKRDTNDTRLFIQQVSQNTAGRFQLSSDGWQAYPRAVDMFLDGKVDYGILVKHYRQEKGELGRYSPPKVIGTEHYCCKGTPDINRLCTSHVERSNLTIRMQTRRMTRLTNAFSKKWENHGAALAIHFAVYNFCRKHGTLKMTPAMAAGLTNHVWSIDELLQESTQ